MASRSRSQARLKLVKQNCIHQETLLRDGVNKDVFVVVKNSPFQVQLGVENEGTVHDPTMNLSQVTMKAELLYDAPGEKAVDFVKAKPLEYKFHVNESGTQAMAECRLKVLTSQLEDMLFRIRFYAVDPLTDAEMASRYCVRSNSIKVISKPEPQRKRKNTKKRTVNDMLLESLGRIEQAQQQHRKMLDRLHQGLENGGVRAAAGGVSSGVLMPTDPMVNPPSLADILHNRSSTSTPPPPSGQSTSEPPAKKKVFDACFPKGDLTHAPDDRPLDFEVAFQDLMDAFDALAPDMRVEHMRKFVEHAGTPNEVLSELHDLFSAEGLDRELGSQHVALEADERDAPMSFNEQGRLKCDCPDCPHKQELDRIEDFYKEVFSLG